MMLERDGAIRLSRRQVLQGVAGNELLAPQLYDFLVFVSQGEQGIGLGVFRRDQPALVTECGIHMAIFVQSNDGDWHLIFDWGHRAAAHQDAAAMRRERECDCPLEFRSFENDGLAIVEAIVHGAVQFQAVYKATLVGAGTSVACQIKAVVGLSGSVYGNISEIWMAGQAFDNPDALLGKAR